MEIPIPIKIRCGKCNADNSLVADTDSDESIVTCTSCGATLGPLGELKKQAREFGVEEIKKRFRDKFGDSSAE